MGLLVELKSLDLYGQEKTKKLTNQPFCQVDSPRQPIELTHPQ